MGAILINQRALTLDIKPAPEKNSDLESSERSTDRFTTGKQYHPLKSRSGVAVESGMSPRVSLPKVSHGTKLELPEKLKDGLAGVSSDKAVLQGLLVARRKLMEIDNLASLPASEVLSALTQMGALGKVDLEAGQTEQLFSEGQPLLARTLTKGTNDGAPSPDGSVVPRSYTPGKVERNTLNNRLRGLNILLTPSTIIQKDVNVATISSHPDRPRWSKMPSVLYTASSEQKAEMAGKVDTYKKVFGNILSFASNNGFTADFVEKVNSGKYSHAELVDEFREQPVIKANLKAPAPYDQLPQSLSEIKQQILDFQADQQDLQPGDAKRKLYPDGSLPHNEVIARLWLWDAAAVDVGQHTSEGLEAAIELQIARKALSVELEQRGTDHPLFTDFMSQQLSVGENNTSLPKSVVLARSEALTENDKKEILNDLKARLQRPVELCRYAPADSTISGIGNTEMTGANVLAAMDSVLKARLGPKAFDAITKPD
jgi:hypothetical protein